MNMTRVSRQFANAARHVERGHEPHAASTDLVSIFLYAYLWISCSPPEQLLVYDMTEKFKGSVRKAREEIESGRAQV